MYLTWLADELRNAGLTVIEEPAWQTRGGNWDASTDLPVAVMHHHTAPPVPYPVDALYNQPHGRDPWRIRCNLNTKPNGTIHVVAAGACNYSSGMGSSVVLTEVRNGTAPTGSAYDRGLQDDVGLNGWYFNIENDHPGDGTEIPLLQWEATTTATVVVCRRLGLTEGSVLGHAESTRRKIDPCWDGQPAHQAMNRIRLQVKSTLLPPGWRKPGDPIVTAADARRVIRYQGTLDPGLVMDLHTTAVVLDLDMQHDIRLRNLEKQ